ncbi:MAG: chemotaxis protein CheD [Spirochaetota bacterium]
MPGKYMVADGSIVLRTYAGSTLVVCLYDETLGIGGITNFIVPGFGRDASITESQSAEFGIAHIEYIIADVIKRGGTRTQLKAKLFGLARISNSGRPDDDIAADISFIWQYMRNEKIPVTRHDLESRTYKEIIFFPEEGRVYARPVTDSVILKEIVRSEDAYIVRETKAFSGKTVYVLFR